MIKKAFLISVFPVVFAGATIAQEVVAGLQSNYAITQHKIEFKKDFGAKSSVSLELPFFDDFSDSFIFPDSKRWSDNYVFINDTYSDRQPTVGVATFDAIDNKGKLYETANHSGFAADTLTSQPINLNYTASDNIMLSFYYQAGGLGDFPEPNDSLTLLFFAPDENKWFSVWRAYDLPDSSFRQAALPIIDEKFLKDGFRFRFINYASLPRISDQSMIGNCDHWNIDYVLLDKNRLESDTVYHDVAFRRGIRSVLKNYESMPWNQFQRIQLQEMGAFITIQYRNNDAIIRNVTRDFNIFDVNRNLIVHSFTAGAANIEPLTNVDYNANLIYTFNSPAPDSARFKITCILKTDDFDPKENDTIAYYQVFKNYFAFDDGTAEMGYGINGQGSRNAMVAYRFNSYIPDTLRSIMICFNDSYQNSNRRAFDLMVWNDNNGIPGDILYKRDEIMVETGDKINGFYNYTVIDGIPINGTFYVGWKQRTETFLNAGLDINTQNNGRHLFWINGEWRQSQVRGALMIRAVVGKPEMTTSIPPDNRYMQKTEITIYPNPATDFIKIATNNIDEAAPVWVTITDLSGRELIKTQYYYGEQINISSLQPGIYFILYEAKGKRLGQSRLIKVR
jgi:hypothetical protein